MGFSCESIDIGKIIKGLVWILVNKGKLLGCTIRLDSPWHRYYTFPGVDKYIRRVYEMAIKDCGGVLTSESITLALIKKGNPYLLSLFITGILVVYYDYNTLTLINLLTDQRVRM